MKRPRGVRGGDGQAEGMSVSSRHGSRAFSLGAGEQRRWVLGSLLEEKTLAQEVGGVLR